MRHLYEYHAWANRRSLTAAVALTRSNSPSRWARVVRLCATRSGTSVGAEWIWLERFQGRSPSSLPDTKHYPDIATLGERWGEFEPRLLNFVRGLTQSDR